MEKNYELCCSVIWISLEYSLNFQVGSAYSILPSAVLLFAPLDNIFQNATESVRRQYMNTVFNLADKEAASAYSKILRPMVYVFFTHQLILLINISFVLLGTCYRSIFLTHVSMIAMAMITLIEAIGYGCYIAIIQNWVSLTGYSTLFIMLDLYARKRYPRPE
ncbi:hypothetical protein AHF37_11476 [Paragonimus kellicotti]|nr:hypothetical protein AHF37_11476 [Paragonimus kellicotti]